MIEIIIQLANRIAIPFTVLNSKNGSSFNSQKIILVITNETRIAIAYILDFDIFHLMNSFLLSFLVFKCDSIFMFFLRVALARCVAKQSSLIESVGQIARIHNLSYQLIPFFLFVSNVRNHPPRGAWSGAFNC